MMTFYINQNFSTHFKIQDIKIANSSPSVQIYIEIAGYRLKQRNRETEEEKPTGVLLCLKLTT
jgi:hypothetical protein